MPLIDACLTEALRSKAKVDYLATPSHHTELLFAIGDDEQVGATPLLWLEAATKCDKYLSIKCTNNTRSLSGASPERHALAQKAYSPILNTVLKRTHENTLSWCTTLFPTAAIAQEAKMGTFEFEQFAYDAMFLNEKDPVMRWKELALQQQKLIEKLKEGSILLFQNEEGTHLEVDVANMVWKNCAGENNFPDGEVFTGPNLKAKNGGVNGRVKVTFPTILKNTEVQGIELQFQNGAVTRATAAQNESFLKAMIDQDPGARYVGEVALGTNYGITRSINNILFDEKIGGSFHIALGKGYPETGNDNNSALHWDLVTDMRKSGKLFLDGELLFEKGKFLGL
jgi:aminopeptidase